MNWLIVAAVVFGVGIGVLMCYFWFMWKFKDIFG